MWPWFACFSFAVEVVNYFLELWTCLVYTGVFESLVHSCPQSPAYSTEGQAVLLVLHWYICFATDFFRHSLVNQHWHYGSLNVVNEVNFLWNNVLGLLPTWVKKVMFYLVMWHSGIIAMIPTYLKALHKITFWTMLLKVKVKFYMMWIVTANYTFCTGVWIYSSLSGITCLRVYEDIRTWKQNTVTSLC